MKRSDIVAVSNEAVARWASNKGGVVAGTRKQREKLAEHKKRKSGRTESDRSAPPARD